MRKWFVAGIFAIALLFSSTASAQDESNVVFDGTFLETGFVIYDYTFGIPVLGVAQVNVGLERHGNQFVWVPVKINPTLGINNLISWIGSL